VAKKVKDKEPVLEILVGIGDPHWKLTARYVTNQVRGKRINRP